MRGIAKALLITATAGAAVSATNPESDNPAPGQFRPDPLEPVRVYTYPDDYEEYYGGAAPGLQFKFEVDDAGAAFYLDSEWCWWWDEENCRALYPDFASACEVFKADPYVANILPSLELIGQRGKFFDEGAYAAAEFRLDEGTRAIPGGRVGFYGRLAAALAERYETANGTAKAAYADATAYAATGIALARKNGKVPKSLGLPPEIRGRADNQAKAFLADFPEVSKPFGFYTWKKELRRVWAHRKWFQLALDTKDEAVVAMALALTASLQENAALQAEYDAILAAHAALTNPAKLRSCNDVAAVVGDAAAALDDVPAAAEALAQDPNTYPFNPDTFCLFPPAATIEEYIWEAIGVFLKSNDDLFTFVVDSIKSHKLTLEPSPGAGWYQFQQYAAEVLLLLAEAPEGEKLRFSYAYDERLEQAFRTMIALTRETHAGGMEGLAGLGAGDIPPKFVRIYVRPEVSLEPVPTYYLRLARSCGFLQNVLEKNFGAGAPGEMRGVREKGSAKDDLADELADIRELYYGLYLESCIDIGLVPELEPGEVADPSTAIGRAKRWLADWPGDPLMKKDVRIIVPVGSEGPLDAEPYLKCWAVVGVEPRTFSIGYAPHCSPACRIIEGDVEEGEDAGNVAFVPWFNNYVILIPRVIEVTIPGSTPLGREEFRKLCDRCDTTAEIVEALENREPTGRKRTVVDGELRELITSG